MTTSIIPRGKVGANKIPSLTLRSRVICVVGALTLVFGVLSLALSVHTHYTPPAYNISPHAAEEKCKDKSAQLQPSQTKKHQNTALA